ncbi:hypothetical protein RCG19_16105 [Neobacillus sp. OS1-2]|uniref:hypothetical protein n=1 Tax=Neobacillus sp. OS1-2 TaxID=3070680 RepID=UPI0027E0EDEE|nr:hypothetical protein [Neobacillus sp. OS1-2]WML38712.1 hypothetical protein RCG19_16105 [Neobacillus sp. OS1-2]
MDKEKIMEVFYELLDAWEDSECTVIHDRGEIGDFEELRMNKEKYKQKFLEALNE